MTTGEFERENLNLAVNGLALADDTVFVSKNCVPAFLVRHIRQQQIVALAIRMYIQPQIPSGQDFWRVVELDRGENVQSDTDLKIRPFMSRKKLIKLFWITRQKCLPCRI